MILYTILAILLFCHVKYKENEDLDTSIFAVFLLSVVFLMYSMVHSLAYEGKYTETNPINISKIAINETRFWIYTEGNEIINTLNPSMSELPSSKTTYLHPQKWWFINIPLTPATYNLNIDELYQKRITGAGNKIE